MSRGRVAAVGIVVLLVGCTVPSPGGTTSPGPAGTSPPPSAVSPSVTPTPTPSLIPDEDLPLRFPVEGDLVDEAGAVIAELHRIAAGLPVLKVDVTQDQATLTALLPDTSVVSYAWRDGQITREDSDIQYFDQVTFDPADYPLDSVGRMFDIADLKGVRGELVLQIVEYREGQVVMTVTSRPETSTVFFRKDGTAVATLGLTSVADITAGLEEVLGDADEAFAVGFNATRGYWADLPDAENGVVLNRSRLGGLPVFETRRTDSPSLTRFDPRLIEPAGLAKAIAKFQVSPDEQCEVTVDMRHQRSGPVATITCGGSTHFADLEGRDMTTLIG